MLFSRVHFKQGKKSDDEDTDPSLLKKNVILKEDRRLSKDYVIGEYLGSGKFGEVKRCEERQTGGQFAAKFVPIASDDDWKSVQNEIAIMNRLRHPRLIQLYDAYSRQSEVIMVLELITGGELFERIIDESFDLNESRCIRFMNEILQGVEYMHNQGVLHLDLKPENILCLSRTSFKIKIIDFGLARFYDGKEMCVLFGTPEFVSPEVISYEPVCPAADMWSVGVICYVMLSGLSPFMGDSQGETLANILKVTYDFDYPEFEEISEEARDFIRKLLIKDPRKRMTATECLKHPWIKKKRQLKRKGTVSKKRLKHFVYRRKWQKAVNAIIALLRMGVVLHHSYQSTQPQISSTGGNRQTITQPSPTPVTSVTPVARKLSSNCEDLPSNDQPQPTKVNTRRTSLKSINNTLFGRITSKRHQSPASRKTSIKEEQVDNPQIKKDSPKPVNTTSRRASILNRFTRGGTPTSNKSKTVTTKNNVNSVQVRIGDEKLNSSPMASNLKQCTKSDKIVQSELPQKPESTGLSSKREQQNNSTGVPTVSKVDLKPNEHISQSSSLKPTVNTIPITNKSPIKPMTTTTSALPTPTTITTTATTTTLSKPQLESRSKAELKSDSATETAKPQLRPTNSKPFQKKVLPQGSSIATRIGFFSSLATNPDTRSKKA